LVTGIILTFTLLIMTTITVSIANVGREPVRTGRSLEREYDSVKDEFGEALNLRANELRAVLAERPAVEAAFNELAPQFETYEAWYGINLDLEWVGLTGTSPEYTAEIAFSMSARETTINEIVYYTIIFY
jgi:hypothetical protein